MSDTDRPSHSLDGNHKRHRVDSSGGKKRLEKEPRRLDEFLCDFYSDANTRLFDAELKGLDQVFSLVEQDLDRCIRSAAGDTYCSRTLALLFYAESLHKYKDLGKSIAQFVVKRLSILPNLTGYPFSRLFDVEDEEFTIDHALDLLSVSHLQGVDHGASDPEKEDPQGLAESHWNTSACVLMLFRIVRGTSIDDISQSVIKNLWSTNLSQKPEHLVLQTMLAFNHPDGPFDVARVELRHVQRMHLALKESRRILQESRQEEERLIARVRELKQFASMKESEARDLESLLEQERQTANANRSKDLNTLQRTQQKFHRLLEESVEMLQDGKTALERDPPKVRVMLDHTGRVIHALNNEMARIGKERNG